MRNHRDITARFPRAPTHEEWSKLTEAQRAEVVSALPDEVTEAELSPPEGDAHFSAKVSALDVLRGFFGRLRRSVYLASELPVYYPGERRFAPDLLAVIDVPSHARGKWMVSAEGKGLDLVLEVHVGGDRRKDAERNVAWFARLGIREYFILDVARSEVLGFRLASPTSQAYEPILPEGGRLPSSVLGLDLEAGDGRLLFYNGNALLLDTTELLAHAHRRVDREIELRKEETRLRQEETRRREEAEARIAALEAELRELKQ